jgi:hypothetical protein
MEPVPVLEGINPQATNSLSASSSQRFCSSLVLMDSTALQQHAGATSQQAARRQPARSRLERMEAAVRTVLHGLGEDVEREGLVDTPKVSCDRSSPAA